MKSLNILIPMTVFALTSAASSGVVAQATMGGAKMGEMKMGDMKMEQPAAAVEMTDGEVRKVDKEARKITIRHGEIKNLDMPAMTMVFQTKDPAVLEKVQQGDKVKFKVSMVGSAMVVTEIEMAK